MRGHVVLSLALGALGCADTEDPPTTVVPPSACAPGEWRIDDACVPAGLPPDMPCPPGTSGEGCIPAGVSSCGEGFEPTADGACAPVLPATSCGEGTLALPGETACHAVAPCGSGTWGDIPMEPGTQFVDQSYAGGGNNGSALAPWTTIGEAVAAVASGGTVAIAQGSYAESVTITGKPVRLVGRCPELVEIVATSGTAAVAVIGTGASGSSVETLATRPQARPGIAVSGALDVVIDRVWVRSGSPSGIAVQNDVGTTSATLRLSLLENNLQTGLNVIGANAVVESVVVRDTMMKTTGSLGRGVNVEADLGTGTPSTLSLQGSLIERNHDAGILLYGSQGTVENTVVRDTSADVSGIGGAGIVAQFDPLSATPTPKITLRSCLVANNADTGIYLMGADATIESSVVRDTRPNGNGDGGNGIAAQGSGAGTPSPFALRDSLVLGNGEAGVWLQSLEAVMERVAVRDQLPNGNGKYGDGVIAQSDGITPATLSMTGCEVSRSRDAGVYVLASHATIEATVVRDTLPDENGLFGRGVAVQDGNPSLDMRASLIEQNHDLGLYVSGAQVTLEQSVIRGTLADDMGRAWAISAQAGDGGASTLTMNGSRLDEHLGVGVLVESSTATFDGCVVSGTAVDAQNTFGDAIALLSVSTQASVDMRFTRIEQSARGALAVFGSHVSYANNAFVCQPFDLIGEQSYKIENLGGNLCGCPNATETCLVESAGLATPAPVDPSLAPPPP